MPITPKYEVLLRLPLDLLLRLDERTTQTRTTRSALIREYLEEGLKRDSRPETTDAT